MFDIETDESDLDIEGRRVDVYRKPDDDVLSIVSCEPDSDAHGEVIGHADLVLLEDVGFITNCEHAALRGTVVGVDMDGEIEWNLMVRMFDNDMCNINYDPNTTNTFDVMEAVRTDEHDLSAGDSVDRAVYASITEEGVGAILPADE